MIRLSDAEEKYVEYLVEKHTPRNHPEISKLLPHLEASFRQGLVDSYEDLLRVVAGVGVSVLAHLNGLILGDMPEVEKNEKGGEIKTMLDAVHELLDNLAIVFDDTAWKRVELMWGGTGNIEGVLLNFRELTEGLVNEILQEFSTTGAMNAAQLIPEGFRDLELMR